MITMRYMVKGLSLEPLMPASPHLVTEISQLKYVNEKLGEKALLLHNIILKWLTKEFNNIFLYQRNNLQW